MIQVNPCAPPRRLPAPEHRSRCSVSDLKRPRLDGNKAQAESACTLPPIAAEDFRHGSYHK
jgi:hypothetical protein